MKKVLVLGKNGQLGRALHHHKVSENWSFLDKKAANLENHKELYDSLMSYSFDVLINAAAYTAVDDAEIEIQKAMDINAEALTPIAQACKDQNALLIHISTDYVFGFANALPLNELTPTNPGNVYGASKLKGEQNIQTVNPHHIILRTSWLYGYEGHNFFNTMLRLAKTHPELNVVFDQVGTPTYVHELAKVIAYISKLPRASQIGGVYHFSNEGVCSWYDFAKSIFELSNIEIETNPVKSDMFPVKAARPNYSVLDKQKIKDTFGIQIPHWRDSLKECINILNSSNG
jgi:dTDP-4-dehydrorhamnose reductase